jgi:hypothetical protein
MKPEVAAEKAAEFGLKAASVEPAGRSEGRDHRQPHHPRAHVAVGLRALAAGKHVYSEKPLGVTFAEGKTLVEAAKAKGCGSARRRTPSSAAATSRRAP